jgi:anti-sigma factor RsiW
MEHEEAKDLFSDYLDGELDAERAAALQEHLQGCDVCRAELERLRQTVRSLSGLHTLPPPAEFVSRVEQTIRRRSRGRFFAPEGVLSRFPFEWISLAVILFVALAIYLFSALDWKVSPPRDAAADAAHPAAGRAADARAAGDAGAARTPPAR